MPAVIHQQYERLNQEHKEIVDEAFHRVRIYLMNSLGPEWHPDNCDHAERLVEAIAQYVCVSATGPQVFVYTNKAGEEIEP